MLYFVAFLEGIITFISPCLLPMLPVYLIYFAGETAQGNPGKTLKNAVGFILGFTCVFVLLGAFAAGIGGLLLKYRTAVNLVTGAVVVVFGLNFMGIFKLGFLNGTHRIKTKTRELGFFSALIFGVVFSIGWTPCVGTFLSSALLMASQQGSVTKGIFMLLVYSLGLGVPFLISALLIDRLKGTFQFIKSHYKIINFVCGALLAVIGILMMTGLINRLLVSLS